MHEWLRGVPPWHGQHRGDAAECGLAGHETTHARREPPSPPATASAGKTRTVEAPGLCVVLAHERRVVIGEVLEEAEGKAASRVLAADVCGGGSQHGGSAGVEVRKQPPPAGLQHFEIVCVADAEAVLVETLAQREAFPIGVPPQVPDRQSALTSPFSRGSASTS